ncbi:MAG: alpha/beta fold hydrolase [Sphingopyxis sp.]|uniref:alpha/beta hydrolase n=1 Tax=Sphingopyxis sp. TaxID=1908224 RepID=UPI002AB93DD5|nr:alpha/beta hydrolase [Sphingopyxis sp.]MDZ3833501.1 alpha/beta fold hydrolase [Sphingopyxis sp.]
MLAAIPLAGCISAVDYGKVRHPDYVADPRCTPQPGAPADPAALPHFFVTSRLPDCRSADIRLLSHRGDRVRQGRFAAPRDIDVGGKTKFRAPLALMDEGDWWQALQAETDRRQGRVLLYVHGYRESFESTSKDAAQMARMTGFDGPVIEYSWPSQGDVLKYAADETNMYHDVRNFRDFLRTLADRPWVKEIVIVAHSLGARLALPAIASADRLSRRADRTGNISTIILASPDIDRETFERDIGGDILAPDRVALGRHITVYASLNDRALSVSRTLHGYPRLGSPYCFNPFEAAALEAKGLPARCYPAAIPGLTVIDTTDVSRGSTGHSNFLRSAPACRDFIDAIAGQKTRPGRVATHLAHVFRLAPDPADPKPDNDRICGRTPDAGDDEKG